jgi:hypothetical protein
MFEERQKLRSRWSWKPAASPAELNECVPGRSCLYWGSTHICNDVIAMASEFSAAFSLETCRLDSGRRPQPVIYFFGVGGPDNYRIPMEMANRSEAVCRQV